MRLYVTGLLVLGLLAGCTADWDSSRTSAKGLVLRSSRPESGELQKRSSDALSSRAGARSANGFASLPDRGELLAYAMTRDQRLAQKPGASFQVRLSEEHAFNATHEGGQIVVPTPDGGSATLTYERHVEHVDGNWSWIGRDENGTDAVLTFGEKAAFGTIPQADGESWRLTTAGGQSWLTKNDRNRIAAMGRGKRASTDMLIPPNVAGDASQSESPGAHSNITMVASDSALAATTVDVLVGYTNGLVAALGGQSQAVTRINNLVDITNQAYTNSGVNAQVRLVGTQQVNFPDATDNGDALEKVSGQTQSGPTTPDPAFASLRAARDTTGADLVVLLRDFRTPQNNGCGIAWLIGSGQTGIEQADAPFGYSVVSDGSDVDEGDGNTYFCRDESFAHEMGHNMGQAHNVENSSSSGVHAYSYGYRESSSNGFYTVMAYALPSGNQTSIRYFANPQVTFSGRPTGTTNADNVRSMNQVLPIVATFRTEASFIGLLVGVNGKCLDARGRGTELGTAIQIYDCNGEPQQQWRWALQQGFGVIRGVGSGRVLDVNNYGVQDGTQLQLWDSTGATNQNWQIMKFAIVAAGGRVLDAVNMSSANGTKIQLWDSTRTPHQTWNFDPARGYITGKDGKCLDVAGFGTDNGTLVQLWTCNDTANQKWSLGANGVILGYGGKCLEAANGGTANGTVVRMWDCNGGAHQSWKVRGQLLGQMSGKCLDDPSSGQTNGSRVHIWQCHPGENQQWTFAWQ